ncbi:MAG: 50S ribosomal protein L29 [Candidatus Gastranaerophilales bacterium]|nr:50S ribosomal protein L29 [Clostridia bacterium]MBQ8886721.1 50S ribosomal protein L29 [Candidatus Gastranaerophilales bacterium]
MKIEEIKGLTIEELNGRLKELNTELFNLRFSHATRNLANPLAIRNVRKEIARVKTIIREKEIKAVESIGGNDGK